MALQPFDLIFLKEKQQVSVAYFNPEGCIGMRLVYPKSIILKNNEIKETSDFVAKQHYDNFLKQIKKISKKAKVSYQDKIFKPNFWISEGVKQRINQNIYLQSNELFII